MFLTITLPAGASDLQIMELARGVLPNLRLKDVRDRMEHYASSITSRTAQMAGGITETAAKKFNIDADKRARGRTHR